MKKQTFQFSKTSTDIYFDMPFDKIADCSKGKNPIFITDENVFKSHQKKFYSDRLIVIKPGESYKTQQTVNEIVKQLIDLKAGKDSILIGVGGGVVTDITGFVASIYMRGVSFAFVPTTVLALTDAAIGGKNGIDVGHYKNMLGLINQPDFILHDYSFLKTLPDNEWKNGFAEIIKHACIKDAAMFNMLKTKNIAFFKKNQYELSKLIYRNTMIKIGIVITDEFEKGERRLLNFGHTIGHAIENQYSISHGQAVSVGMACAAKISKQLSGFSQTPDLVSMLKKYGLPVSYSIDKKLLLKNLNFDKKKSDQKINFILLKKIGKAIIQPLSAEEIIDTLNS